MAEQEPVEKENIVELHATEHDKIPAKEAEKSKAVLDPVPRGKNGCGQKQQDRDPLYDPADDVRPAEPLFLSGIASRFSFGAEEKNRLS